MISFFFLRSASLKWEMERRESRMEAVLVKATSMNTYGCAYVTYDLILKMELLGQIICIFKNVVHIAM